jgi:hypothetical protein
VAQYDRQRGEYITSPIDRGAESLLTINRHRLRVCASLKAEARRRAAAGEFFGFIGFVSFRAAPPVGR